MRRLRMVALAAVLLTVTSAAPLRGHLSVPSALAQAGASWEVLAGSDIAAESLAANAFLPKAITINAGDTVTWAMRGFHTVTFNAGKAPLEPIVPGPGPGELTLGPAFLPFPPGEQASGLYDGTRQVSTGAPLGPEGEPFRLTFTRPGVYPYLCTVHPGMEGQVTVLPAGAALAETPAQVTARGQAELQGLIAGFEGILPSCSRQRSPRADGRSKSGGRRVLRKRHERAPLPPGRVHRPPR
ncbi:MAG: plastocyanin/azurin family copper-binding protein [Dehalococcoidia bacterium]